MAVFSVFVLYFTHLTGKEHTNSNVYVMCFSQLICSSDFLI